MVKRKLPERVIKKARRFVEFAIKNNVKVEEAYLFGSYVKGQQHRGSDIDVCIISSEFTNPWESFSYLYDIASKKPYFYEVEGHGYTPELFNQKRHPYMRTIKQEAIKLV